MTVAVGLSILAHLVLLAMLLLRPKPPVAAAPTTLDVEFVKRGDGQPPSDKADKHTRADQADRDKATRQRANLSAKKRARHAALASSARRTTRSVAPTVAPPTKTRPDTRAKTRSNKRATPDRAKTRRAAKRRARDAARRRATAKRARQAACQLSMRGCNKPDAARRASKKAQPARAKKKRDRSRFASFFARGRKPRPHRTVQPQTQVSSGGLAMARYADGGRLLRAVGNRSRRPGFGEQRLLALASETIGGTSGRRACDIYSSMPRGGSRLAVIMVDTSGSVVAKKKAPAALVCAAGAVLSALDRGYFVALVNFSTRTRYLKPTRDREVIYKVMSTLQGGGTRLPPVALLKLPPARSKPHDYVLITDAAIANLARVLPGYGRALKTNRSNRGLLYVLGQGASKGVSALTRVGFHADKVEKRNEKSFARYAADTLRKLLPL